MRSIFLLELWCFLFLIAFTACDQAKIAYPYTSCIDQYLSNLEEVGLNGTVLIAVDGVAIISKGFGYSNREMGIKNSPHTIFDIGSITKQFTATAILKLELQGKLSTDDALAKFKHQSK